MTETAFDPTVEERLRYELAIPYVATFESIPDDGKWIRRGEYPELPDCVIESSSTLEMIDQLEQLRINIIVGTVLKGGELPTDRAPLPGGTSGLSEETLRTIIQETTLAQDAPQ